MEVVGLQYVRMEGGESAAADGGCWVDEGR